eukprot:gene10274-biopygen5852
MLGILELWCCGRTTEHWSHCGMIPSRVGCSSSTLLGALAALRNPVYKPEIIVPGRILMLPLLVDTVPVGLLLAYMPHSGLRVECKECWQSLSAAAHTIVSVRGWGLAFAADGNADDLRGLTLGIGGDGNVKCWKC